MRSETAYTIAEPEQFPSIRNEFGSWGHKVVKRGKQYLKCHTRWKWVKMRDWKMRVNIGLKLQEWERWWTERGLENADGNLNYVA